MNLLYTDLSSLTNRWICIATDCDFWWQIMLKHMQYMHSKELVLIEQTRVACCICLGLGAPEEV